MLNFDMPLLALCQLRSNDYPDKCVGELRRENYPNREFVFENLAKDIQENGITEPLRVVDNKLVNGHHRAIIAIEQQMESVPVEYSGMSHFMVHS